MIFAQTRRREQIPARTGLETPLALRRTIANPPAGSTLVAMPQPLRLLRSNPRRPVLFACLLAGSLLGAPASVAQSASTAQNISAAPPASNADNIFPLSAVHAGLLGTAYTVFQGTQPEPMQVEILGVLHDAIGPGKDMILARLHGSRPEYTGVAAGMSGSPVYVNGKLLGAIGYRIGQFSKEPLAGITPIEQMLQVLRQSAPISAQAQTTDTQADVQAGTQADGSDLALDAQPSTELKPIAAPLVLDGYSPAALALFQKQFGSLGFAAEATGLGGADPTAKQPQPILPGSAISAIIVQGDLNMSATCTVTYIDAHQLLACGHPVTQYGNIDLPMTKAEVVTTIASPLAPMKIINTTETVGAFTGDRASGILGQLGAKAPMLPVTVTIDGIAQPHTYHFSVAEHPRLTPGALTVSVYQALLGTNGYNDQASYRMHGVLAFNGAPTVTMDDLFAPEERMALSQRFGLLYGNARQLPPVRSMTLRFDELPGRRTAALQQARVIDPIAHPGGMVTVEATLLPYRQAPRMVRIPVRLPETLQAGTVDLLVSNGALLDQMTSPLAGQQAEQMDLETAIARLNELHRNDRIYVTLLAPQPQAMVDGARLPAVPLSMANVLQTAGPGGNGGGASLRGQTAVPLGSTAVDAVVDGTQTIPLEIRP
jgi:hypothetical protein